eukprot:CAMPEP_0182453734 /NCGR_PEP_ID=MMETSP1319-20130603/672_1 /TAXON_ID=172717 /ORGANISM="Bolidomonas pacifica, Strain RCC208" /LENGTH=217 /DNA_ID=CAMNT_0024651687 /DNA_START=314 /DNA_END=966 /DNA_ORIENTATION=+
MSTSFSLASSPSPPSAFTSAPAKPSPPSPSPPLHLLPPPSTPNCLVSGLVPVLKPASWTSFDCVARVRSTLSSEARVRLGTRKRPKVKVGHGGTLDPMATGVLVVGIGKGTRVMADHLKGPKKYEATFEVGYTTDTLDAEGKVTNTTSSPLVLSPSILDGFRGPIMQVPPMYSAIRKDGRRLYELAREGKGYSDVVVPARPVHVHELAVPPPPLHPN